MNTIQINFSFDFCCFVFIIFLIGIYLSKKNANNIDNKIYKQLLIWNFFTLFFNTLYQCIFVILGNVFWGHLFCRIYAICSFLYFFYLTIYVLVISLQYSESLFTKVTKSFFFNFAPVFFLLIICFPLFIFDFTVNITSKDIIISGLLYNYISIIFLLLAISLITIIIVFKKHIERSKLIPFYVLFIFSAIALSVSSFFPSLVSMVVIMTVITYLMYHTIENPDMKMVAELTLAKDSAEKASRAKTEFLSSMSHELKTPLNAILGFSNVIKESSDVDAIHSDINEVINSSNKLLDMVDSILNVNQLDNNNLEIININYNITDIVLNINDNIDYRIKEKNLTYTFNISNNVPKTLYGDSNKIKTIITNLLSNAVKYTDEGAINLDINCLNNKDDCNLTITVSDTGRGIGDDQRESLFEKFNRLDEDRDSNIEGTGLGLNITKSLVNLLEGDISVSSIPGEGSTFTVKIKQKIVD